MYRKYKKPFRLRYEFGLTNELEHFVFFAARRQEVGTASVQANPVRFEKRTSFPSEAKDALEVYQEEIYAAAGGVGELGSRPIHRIRRPCPSRRGL